MLAVSNIVSFYTFVRYSSYFRFSDSRNSVVFLLFGIAVGGWVGGCVGGLVVVMVCVEGTREVPEPFSGSLQSA